MSRNAVLSGRGEKPPGWAGLSEQLVETLCPGNDPVAAAGRTRILRETGAVSGFLRLAEKHEARFGRASLDDFLTRAIADHSMTPSEMHLDLMRLPWTDVFTTNWDTLLERAAMLQSTRNYNPV